MEKKDFYENQTFYGKKYKEFNEKEMLLLEGDLSLYMMISSYERMGVTDKLLERHIDMLIAKRYAIISEILEIDVHDDADREEMDMIIDVIEKSDYGYSTFKKNISENAKEFKDMFS